MSADDEQLRARRKKRRALRVPVDEVPRRSAVSGIPPAPPPAIASAPGITSAAPRPVAARALDDIPLDTDTELELVSDEHAELSVVEPTDELDLDAPEVEPLEAEPTRVASSERAPAIPSEPPPVPAAPVGLETATEGNALGESLVAANPVEADAAASVDPDARVDEEVGADAPVSAADAKVDANPPVDVDADASIDPGGTVDAGHTADADVPAPPMSEAVVPDESERAPEVEAGEGAGAKAGSELTAASEPNADAADSDPVIVHGMVRVSTIPPPPDPDAAAEPLLVLHPESGESALDDDELAPLESEPTLPRVSLRATDDDEPELTIDDDALEEEPLDEDDELELDDDAEELELHEVEPPPPPEEGADTPEPVGAEPSPPPPQRPREAKPRRRPWFETFFSDDYLRTVRPPTRKDIIRDCDFIEARLGLAAGATILDVGCGLGLHAIELTRRGFLVVGLDLSLPMLSRAGDEAQDERVKINFLHGDMREMTFDGAFDAVLCWGTTFGYFDDETNKRVVERLHRALKPRGVLLLDVVNRDYVIRSQPNLIWFEGDGCLCMEESKFNYFLSRLEVKRTVMLDDGRQREGVYTLRLYALHELGLLLHQQGFRVAEVSGWMATPGVFFGADSPRILILAERRVDGDRAKKSDDAPSRPPPAPGVPPTDD